MEFRLKLPVDFVVPDVPDDDEPVRYERPKYPAVSELVVKDFDGRDVIAQHYVVDDRCKPDMVGVKASYDKGMFTVSDDGYSVTVNHKGRYIRFECDRPLVNTYRKEDDDDFLFQQGELVEYTIKKRNYDYWEGRYAAFGEKPPVKRPKAPDVDWKVGKTPDEIKSTPRSKIPVAVRQYMELRDKKGSKVVVDDNGLEMVITGRKRSRKNKA